MSLWAFFALSVCTLYTAKCDYDASGALRIVDTTGAEDRSGYAWARWDDGINTTGWYTFHVQGREGGSDEEDAKMVRCAGALEGFLSHESIYNHFMLIMDMKSFSRAEPHYPDGWEEFMTDNMNFVEESIRAYQEVDYWKSVRLVYEQFLGLCDGYQLREDEVRAATGVERRMTKLDHWILQSQGDLGDSAKVVGRYTKGIAGPTRTAADARDCDPETLGDHCTGLIKLTKDFSDVYVAHDAWSSYLDLHGALKEYNLPCRRYNAHRVTMSTRVGKLSSYDDFYIADSGLLVIETTMTVLNESLYDYVKAQNLFTWLRAIHATWVAHNGSEWTETFIKHNSGTYNNQYLIVDSNKFVPFQKPTEDLLWVIEQYPGPYWKREDITEQLTRDLYFPSINKPHFKELFNIAGYPEKIRQMGETGNFYEYEKSARYMIIQREAPRLEDFEDFKAFMRYNNWKRDAYSNGDASQQIMSRYDQRRYGDPYGLPKMFGGLDSKCLKLSEAVTKMNFHAIASPSNENNPTWEFDEGEWKGVKYDGLPKTWNFNWTQFSSDANDNCNKYTNKADCIENVWCGWCFSNKKCMAGTKVGPMFDCKCSGGWTVKAKIQSWAKPVVIAISVIAVIFVIFIFAVHIKYSRKDQL